MRVEKARNLLHESEAGVKKSLEEVGEKNIESRLSTCKIF